MNICAHCGAIHDESLCPDCSTAHDKACQQHPTFNYGRRIPARNLDQQEGNAEEYFGGPDFAVKGGRA